VIRKSKSYKHLYITIRALYLKHEHKIAYIPALKTLYNYYQDLLPTTYQLYEFIYNSTNYKQENLLSDQSYSN